MQQAVGNFLLAQNVQVEVEFGAAWLFMHYDADFGLLKADPEKIKQLSAEAVNITYKAQITLTSPYTGLTQVYNPLI